MVHSRTDFAHIGEANAELQQARKFMRFIPARRDADLVERAPKAIAGMRIVVTDVGGSLAGGGADEDQAQVRLKLVRKFFHRVRSFVKAGECRIRIAGRGVANERGRVFERMADCATPSAPRPRVRWIEDDAAACRMGVRRETGKE